MLENETQTAEVKDTAAPVVADTPAPEDAADDAAPVENEDEGLEKDDLYEEDKKELEVMRRALEKRNRYNKNLRTKNIELRDNLRRLEHQLNRAKSDFGSRKTDAPSMDKFESVIDYMKADQNFTVEQKFAEQEHKAQLAALEQQQQMALQQQANEVAQQVQELLSSNPDFKATITANSNVINAMPPHIEKMVAELDDAPAATYALAKEGRLQSLYSMPPELAAAHLVQAEIRGQQYLQQSTAPKAQPQQAPKPIGAMKGSGKSTNRSPDDMSADQLMSWLKS